MSVSPIRGINFDILGYRPDYDTGISLESQFLKDQFSALNQHYDSLISTLSAYHRFYNLKRQWKHDTMLLSSTTQIIMHPAYQQIIGMGRIALPFIFNELRRENDHWYWALKCITGENPITPEARGNMLKMREAWLNWGRTHGYIY